MNHYTHAGYENCLANKTIVFIGDSRVRYQFMHLAAFLKTKQRMKCEDYGTISGHTVSLSPECYLIEHEHHNYMEGNNGWASWYKRSTEMINSNLSNFDKKFEQTTLCDCYRGIPFDPETTYENRFLIRSTPHGNIKLIYLQNFRNKITMSMDFPPFSPFNGSPKRCKSGECGAQNRTVAFEGNLSETVWNILPLLNATHAFVSLGWEHLFGFQEQSEYSCAIKSFENFHNNIKIYLSSHPPHVGNTINPTVAFDAKKLKCDCGVLDRSKLSRGIPRDWYWDSLHVLSILNEEYNHLLVEKLCPIVRT